MRKILIIISLFYVTGSCTSTKASRENVKQPIVIEGFYIEKYRYGFDATVNDKGYWFYSRYILFDNKTTLLAGSLHNYDNIFQCKQYKALIDQIDKARNPTGLAFRQNYTDEFYLDSTSNDLYYIVKIKGEFLLLEESFCKTDKDALLNVSIKPPCKISPLPINKFPFLLPINFIEVRSLHNLNEVRLGNDLYLKKVKYDTLKFWPCY